MMHKANINARMIFAWMVPLTLFAFYLGNVSTKAIDKGALIPSWPDYCGFFMATIGVCMFNWYEEKP